MPSLYSHRSRRLHRKLLAAFLATIYLTITLSPLASLAMHSKVVAHVVTGECSGECDICGCSLESRANHTCCCAIKKQHEDSVAKFSGHECCTPKVATAPVAAKGNCCSNSLRVEPVVDKHECCAKNKQHQYDEHIHKTQKMADRSKNETVYKCGCPCGKRKLLALSGFGSNELLPIILSERVEPQHVETIFADLSHRLASRYSEPPEPPPRLLRIS